MEPLLNVDDLALTLHKTVSSIHSDICRNPRSLPPVCRIPGTRRLLWRAEDVERWLASFVTAQAAPLQATLPAVTIRRGRPSKVDQVARERAKRKA